MQQRIGCDEDREAAVLDPFVELRDLVAPHDIRDDKAVARQQPPRGVRQSRLDRGPVDNLLKPKRQRCRSSVRLDSRRRDRLVIRGHPIFQGLGGCARLDKRVPGAQGPKTCPNDEATAARIHGSYPRLKSIVGEELIEKGLLLPYGLMQSPGSVFNFLDAVLALVELLYVACTEFPPCFRLTQPADA